MSACLLESVRGLIERTYRVRSGLGAIAPFVIGDRGLRRLYTAAPDGQAVGTADGRGARTLVRDLGDRTAACIYFPDAMIRLLEAYPPQAGVGEENLQAFAAFVEEIDHLLMIAGRSRDGRPVRLFELELHANVSKYLVIARFLAGRAATLSERRRVWLRRRLFDDVSFGNEDRAERERYEDAARWAVRLLDRLPRLSPAATIETLRRFHDAPVADNLRWIDGAGA